MATPAITINANNAFKKTGVTASNIAASESTAPVTVLPYNKITAIATTASFGTGNITLTAQGSLNGTTWVTLGSALTIAADGGAYSLGSATATQDISTYSFVRWTRGADTNVGTVFVQFQLSK